MTFFDVAYGIMVITAAAVLLAMTGVLVAMAIKEIRR